MPKSANQIICPREPSVNFKNQLLKSNCNTGHSNSCLQYVVVYKIRSNMKFDHKGVKQACSDYLGTLR